MKPGVEIWPRSSSLGGWSFNALPGERPNVKLGFVIGTKRVMRDGPSGSARDIDYSCSLMDAAEVKTKRLLLALLTLTLLGCKGDKVDDTAAIEYAEDIKRVCNAKELSGASNADPTQAPMMMATFLKGALTTKKAQELMANMASMTPSAKTSTLRDEAKKAGLASCPLADER